MANGTVAGGIGGTLEYSNKLKTGEQSLDLNGALGAGAGAFAGLEIDLANFSVPSFAETPIFLDSFEVKVGDGLAAGLKLHFDVGGSMTMKGFGGVGLGGKGLVNKPLSLGVNMWKS